MTTNAPTTTKKQTARVLTSAAIGQFVEWYDFVVYAYTASVIATLFFPSGDRIASLLLTFAVYGVGFVMRPVGAIFFGHLGDRIGRRNVLAAVILLMGLSTAGIGLVPTYAKIGILAPILLLVCRLLQGASAGAETTGANALVAESSPPHRRGFFVAFTYAFANLPAVFAALFVLALTTLLSDDQFEAWGWRIPFLLGGVLALVGLYIRTRVDETPEFTAAKKKNRVVRFPLKTAIKEHPKQIFFAFAIAALASLGFYTLTGYFVTYLRETVGLSANDALIANSVALTLAFAATILGGWLSDWLGRRPMLIIGALISAASAYPSYLLASTGSLPTAVAGQSLLAVCLALFFGPFGVAFLEIFPPHVRFSGAGFGYNISYVVFGGTAPYFSLWLVDTSGSLLAPAAYMTIVALGVAVVGFFLPKPSTADLPES